MLYDAPLLLGEFPPEVPFGFLGRILPTSRPAELRFQLHPIPAPQAGEILHRAAVTARAELASGSGSVGGRPAQLAQEADVTASIARDVAAREQELWRFGVSLHALGRSPARAERVRDDLRRGLESLGFRSRLPLYEASRASAAPSLGGTEVRPSGYWHTLTTDGVASFFPFVDEMVADPEGILVGLLLDDATPVLLNRWSHASYSWALFGTTGSGKTFAAALWAMRSRWMSPQLDVIVIDPLGEFGGFVRALGGTLVPMRANALVQVNPLDPSTTAGDLDEKASRVTTMVSALFPSLRDEESAQLDSVLRRRYDAPGPPPTFSDLIDGLPESSDAGRLRGLLEVFRTGSLRHLNGPTTLMSAGSPLSFDLAGVPSQQLPFYLAFCLDFVFVRLRTRPGRKLLIVDEAHLLTRDPRTAEFLERLVRLARHFDAGVLLLSQNPDDVLATESGRALARNLRATTFLRVTAVSSTTREFFRLTEAEADWLPRARLPREAGYAEGLLRLGPGHLPIAVVASTPEYEFLRGVLSPPASTLNE
ncbi:MAG: DUF87 domain-containing protein [Thermoplasmata archaeon]